MDSTNEEQDERCICPSQKLLPSKAAMLHSGTVLENPRLTLRTPPSALLLVNGGTLSCKEQDLKIAVMHLVSNPFTNGLQALPEGFHKGLTGL